MFRILSYNKNRILAVNIILSSSQHEIGDLPERAVLCCVELVRVVHSLIYIVTNVYDFVPVCACVCVCVCVHICVFARVSLCG